MGIMIGMFQQKQADLTKELVDDALDIFQVSLAISRVRNTIDVSQIEADDIEAIGQVCDEVIDGYSFDEFSSDDLLALVLEESIA